MTTLFDEGKAYATKHPKRSANPDGSGALTSWEGWCQSLAWRFSDAYGHGANPSFDNALHAAQASGKLNKDWKSAKPGAYHYWGTGVSPDGHVGIDLKGGGSWILMASNHITTVWGDAIGCASWTQYQNAIGDPKGAKYLGWSMKNGTGYITVPKSAPAPVKSPVAPSKPVTPIAPATPAPAVSKPATPVVAKPVSKKKETFMSAKISDVTPAELGVILPTAKSRKLAYSIYAGASLLVTNVAIAFSALQASFPAWLVVAIAIIGNLAAPFGALAIANTSSKK